MEALLCLLLRQHIIFVSDNKIKSCKDNEDFYQCGKYQNVRFTKNMMYFYNIVTASPTKCNETQTVQKQLKLKQLQMKNHQLQGSKKKKQTQY